MCGLVAILNYSSDGEQTVRMAESGSLRFLIVHRLSERGAVQFPVGICTCAPVYPRSVAGGQHAVLGRRHDLCIVFNGQIYIMKTSK